MSKSQGPPFPAHVIEAIAQVLGGALTGSQIGFVLGHSTIDDVDGPQQTKWKRIYNALASRQNRDQSRNCVVRFINEAMTPVRYRDSPATMARIQGELNEILIHEALKLNDAGKVARVKGGKATTLEEAARRASVVHKELERHGAHPDVLRYCTTELFQRTTSTRC